MFTLKVLGGAALEGPEGPIAGRAAQKRRLALLALLAMSRTNRVSRDKLVAYLWPDRPEESGRHLLSDAVYVLNRALGPDTLSGVGDELRLSLERVTCDARAFEEAAAADHAAAVRLYTGPFLDGFFLDGSEEFESWAARERERLAGLCAASLEQVALAREAAADHRGAVDVWRRLSSDDPYNSRLVISLTRALERSGDRGGALLAAQAHAAFLRKELGLHAPADLQQVIASLQAAPPALPAPAQAPETVADISARRPEGLRHIGTVPGSASRLRGARVASWAIVVVLLAAAVVWVAPWRTAGTATPLQSIAVMPFDDAGGDPAAPLFGDGIADELTTQLGRERELKVAARTSAFALKGKAMDARAIGRALSVDALLEGSVRRGSDRVRVAVRLVNARDGYQIWAETWERPLEDLPALHAQIASGVVQALNGRRVRADAGAAAPVVRAEAYQLYLQGRYLWHQRTRESLTRAAEVFQASVALAPDYAPAHSGLADAYAVSGFYDYMRPTDAFPRARAAAQRALALDPRLAQAHASLGYVALYHDWNWAEAEASFERAIELNPSYSVGHQWYGNYLTARGRFDQAKAAMRRAQDVDPLSLIASAALGWVHFYAREFDAAIEQCRRTLELNPRFELAHLWAGWAEEGAGRYAAAVTRLGEAARLSNGAVALASLGRAQALSGDRAAARQTLARLHREHREYVPTYELAKLHLALDERDEAIALLQRAHRERSHSIVFVGVDPQLDALRQDPRFRALETSIAAVAAR